MQSKEIRKNVLSATHPYYATSLHNLGSMYREQALLEKALPLLVQENEILIQRLKTQFTHLTEKEKTEFLETLKGSLHAFYSFIAEEQQNHPELVDQAFASAIATKGLLLKSTLGMERAVQASEDSSLQSTFAEWEKQKRLLTGWQQKSKAELERQQVDLEEETQKAEQLEKELSLEVSAIGQQFKADTAGFAEIQAQLGKKEAAIELVCFPFRNSKDSLTDTVVYAAFVVKPQAERPELVLLWNRQDLENKFIKGYANGIKHGLLDPKKSHYDPDLAGDLYDAFWKPFSPALADVKTLYISPDGVFNQLNPVTLLNHANKKYLGEELELVQLTNCRDLVLSTTEKKEQDAFLLGNPDYGAQRDTSESEEKDRSAQVYVAMNEQTMRSISASTSLAQLPGTEKEVKRIAKLLKREGYQIETTMGTQSTEAALKNLQGPKIVHLVTHGFFAEQAEAEDREDKLRGVSSIQAKKDPLLRSGLLLAGAQTSLTQTDKKSPLNHENDGILTAKEAMALNLQNTDLVVLSACETELGEVKNGEGVYGLQRALMVAGAQNLIISLWIVSDEATQLLMSTFYENWLGGKDKRQAFYATQNKVREKYSSPYYWGAFVMLGE